ncbi:hypothetical protein B0T10DRAFT_181095 [Thelonectria olida]|uniref:Uncharacterized protein n=1 Tax=Thelonectria olida TaxID=1576542 RepID=A0A9P8WI24_9HYPO|nr:hypothetical protein B0T10DRAFT_181095 [Thelonectria olida]
MEGCLFSFFLFSYLTAFPCFVVQDSLSNPCLADSEDCLALPCLAVENPPFIIHPLEEDRVCTRSTNLLSCDIVLPFLISAFLHLIHPWCYCTCGFYRFSRYSSLLLHFHHLLLLLLLLLLLILDVSLGGSSHLFFSPCLLFMPACPWSSSASVTLALTSKVHTHIHTHTHTHTPTHTLSSKTGTHIRHHYRPCLAPHSSPKRI